MRGTTVRTSNILEEVPDLGMPKKGHASMGGQKGTIADVKHEEVR